MTQDQPIQFRKRRKKSRSKKTSITIHDFCADDQTNDNDENIMDIPSAKTKKQGNDEEYECPFDFNKNENEEEEEEELKYDALDPDPFYDSLRDRSNQQFVNEKYAKQSAIRSECTLCCANCFVFISYISEKCGSKENEFRSFSVSNCFVNSQNKIICNQCNTELGQRDVVRYLTAETTEKNMMDIKNDDDALNEDGIWKLISSDFSTLKAPSLRFEDDYNDEQTDDFDEEAEKNKLTKEEAESNDEKMYLYHLTNVFPGLI